MSPTYDDPANLEDYAVSEITSKIQKAKDRSEAASTLRDSIR